MAQLIWLTSFSEMRIYDAQKALDIYRRAGKQAERLSEFYDMCTSLDIGRGERYAKIEQPPVSFIHSMEEYIQNAAHTSTVRKDMALDAPEVILAIDCEKTPEVLEKSPSSPPLPEPLKVEATVQPDDLLGLNDPVPEVSTSDEKNASTLAIVPVDVQSTTNGPDQANGVTSWELALVTALNSNESIAASSKPAEGQYNHTLYDDATKTSSQNMSYNPWEQSLLANPMMAQTAYDPFYASNTLVAPPTVQMEAMANQQQQAFMLQQQQQQQMMLMMQPQQQHFNSFGNPYGAATHPYGSGVPVQAYNACTRLI